MSYKATIAFGEMLTRKMDDGDKIENVSELGGHIAEVSFESKEAYEAYFQGLNDMDGWNQYMTLEGELLETYSHLLQSTNIDPKDVECVLLSILSAIPIDKPENFDEMLAFCCQDIKETADPESWSDGDVAIAFRRWIEMVPEQESA